jgi:hypothetical protein
VVLPFETCEHSFGVYMFWELKQISDMVTVVNLKVFVTNFRHVLGILRSCYVGKYINMAIITPAHELLSSM